MSNELNPALAFLKALEDGYTPTSEQCMQICYALDEAMAPEPISDHLTISFRCLGDAFSRAIRANDASIANAKEFFKLRKALATHQQQGEKA